jgi:hypothetical protein
MADHGVGAPGSQAPVGSHETEGPAGRTPWVVDLAVTQFISFSGLTSA